MVAKREISIIEKNLKIRQTLQIFKDIVFKKLPYTGHFSSLKNLICMIR